MGSQLRGIFLLSLTAFIWGTAFVAQKQGMDHLGPLSFLGIRNLIATLSIMPVILASSVIKRRRGVVNSYPGTLPLLVRGGVICGVIIFLCGIFQQVGIIYTSVGKAGFITTLYILIVPIFGLFMGRAVKARVWFCVALALTGMYLLCVKESEPLNKGDVYIFFCALFDAVHILVVDRYSPKIDGVKLSAIQFFVCGLIGTAAAVIIEAPGAADIASAMPALLYAGVLSSGVGFTFQIIAQRDVNPVAASLIMSIESVFAALTGWIVLKEIMTAKEIAGCALIFAATIMVQILEVMSQRGKNQNI